MAVTHTKGIGTIEDLGSSGSCRAGNCVYSYDAQVEELQLTPGGNNCDGSVKDVTCVPTIDVNEPLATQFSDLLQQFPDFRVVACCRQAASWPASVGG